ncbi:ROK family transcriptional regulator [Streptomyces armeniacus]|uniref:ROK family transcriptional regulator n=1 Tax=Streptomyces armeniacus TaxID=83291 RepID=A0A345XSY7_9ACTN|nr:ROK family transcriptional regulator [Streptomyces armeniacus]AXK34753.1 ROK family transcriptional regulator [Streptomyces armeniacus]
MLCGMQSHDGPLTRLRRSHEELVLDLLRKHGSLSRAELGKHSGLSRTTLYEIIGELVASGAVVASAPDPALRKRGRPVETLTLNPEAGQAIGIDFARRAVHVAAANVAHEIVGSASEAHAADLSWEDRVDLAQRLVGSLTGGALRLGPLNAIGAGVVGPVGDPGGEAAYARGLDGLPGLLHKRFGVPVLLDNNTRLAALAESVWGAAAGDQDVLYLRLSHGVGGGLVVGGSLHRGAYGLSGEFGHITVVPAGARCECGGDGCLETVASVGAVLDAYRAAGGHADDVTALLDALGSGDETAESVLRSAGRQVGLALAAVCNAVGPGVIVIGGELAAAGDALVEPVEEALTAHILPLSRHRVDLRRATLGEVGGALGGIALVLHESPLLARYPAQPDSEEDA